MRLLSLNESGKLNPTVFTGTTPPYAILSHNWGNEEFIFTDLIRNIGTNKAGYRKIEFCAKQAAHDQLQYFWVDTCCIDKWNLRELSKSINSMFYWYQNAAKCYVFLSDVSVPTAIDALQQSTWEKSFRASRWFTRGWTLQELIAPTSVEFFSLEGHRLGDKGSLEQLIHEITGIPIKVLQNHTLDEFSVSVRMTWADNRKTTEAEDSAYCLLGILDVFMPCSYGEGKQKAWKRLQDEVDRANTVPFIVPFSQNDRFVGYELELTEMEGELFTSDETTKIAITGPSGIGKSQLSLELVYRTRQRYKNCSVFWIPANNIDGFDQACATIAQKLNIPGWDDEKADVKKLVQLHLSKEISGQWLMIYDNANSISPAAIGFPSLRASLVDYMPQSKLGSIIFTTANSDVAKTLASNNIIELRQMTLDSAQRVLEKHLDNPALTTEKQDTELLLNKLAYLPLAIVQAAACININNNTIRDYQSLLSEQQKQSLKLSIESGDDLQHCGTNNPVATTWLVSIERIRHITPLAADHLFFMSCMDRNDIPLDLLPKASSTETSNAVEMLNSYALITRRPAESAIDIHQLVHVAVREWLQKQELLGEWNEKAISHLLQEFPDYDSESRSKWRRLLPHAKNVLAQGLTESNNGSSINLASKCGLTLYSDGRYDEAEELFMQVIDTRKRVLGDSHPDTLSSMANIASTYRSQGRWEEAEELELQVMDMRKTVLGDSHPDTLTSIADLASTFWKQGRWKETEELFMQVVDMRKRVLGDSHLDTLTSMTNLASTFWKQGRWKEAEEQFVQVRDTCVRVLGDSHPDTLSSMANLAATYRMQSRWKEAEELNVQVVDTSVRVLGDSHPDTLTYMSNLASTYRNQGRWKDAEELELQVMDMRKRVLGNSHPDTLTSMANLAATYRMQGRLDEAEELQTKELDICTKELGAEHPDTLVSMHNLTSIFRAQGRSQDALSLMRECYKRRKQTLGAEHPYTQLSYETLKGWEKEEV